MKKNLFQHFFSFSKDKKEKYTKGKQFSRSTATDDATRFIVTFGRVLLWKSRGIAITRKDYVLSRKGRINHSSTDNLTRKSVTVLDSICWKKNMSTKYYKKIPNLKIKTLVCNKNYHIISKTTYFANNIIFLSTS